MSLLLYFIVIFSNASSVNDCETKVRDLLCVTDYVPVIPVAYGIVQDPFLEISSNQNRSCSLNDEQIKDTFMEAYKQTPDLTKKLFCGLKKILLEKGTNIPYGGRIDLYYDYTDFKDESISGDIKSVQIKVIGQMMKLNIPGRIERQEFCSDAQSRRLISSLLSPTNNISIMFQPDSKNCDLLYTLIHESGHILDNANGDLSKVKSWTDLSFNTQQEFSHGIFVEFFLPKINEQVYFQFLSKQFNGDQLSTFFSEFNQTPFTSIYSASSEVEDFAEEFTLALFPYNYEVFYNSTILSKLDDRNSLATRKVKINYMKNLISDPNTKTELDSYYRSIRYAP